MLKRYALLLNSFLSNQENCISAHGTFIGTVRLEPHKPTQVQVDSVISFGASTRSYTLREKPTIPGMASAADKSEKATEEGTEDMSKGGLLGLPESDTELNVSVRTLALLAFHERVSPSKSILKYVCN